MEKEKNKSSEKKRLSRTQIEEIQRIAEDLRYGTITLVFQDWILVQIDRNEKIRFQ